MLLHNTITTENLSLHCSLTSFSKFLVDNIERVNDHVTILEQHLSVVNKTVNNLIF